MTTINQTNQSGTPLIIQGTSTQSIQQPINDIPGSQQEFPVRTLKIFGGIQIGLGVLLGLLSIIGVIFDVGAMNKICDSYSYPEGRDCWRRAHHSHQLFVFDLTCLVSSGWYVLTGFLPMCMSRKRASSWRGLRVGFMVCSIIGAAIFVPTMFSLGVIGTIFRTFRDPRIAVLSGFMTVLSFAEWVVAITSASYCCCCTPWNNQNQPTQLMFMSTSHPGMFVNLQQSQIPVMSSQQNSQPTAGMGSSTSGMLEQTPGMVHYPRAQQYFIATSQPQQFLQNVSNQPLTDAGESQQNITADTPPAYKE